MSNGIIYENYRCLISRRICRLKWHRKRNFWVMPCYERKLRSIYPNKQNINLMGGFRVRTTCWSHRVTARLCTMLSILLCVVRQHAGTRPDDWRPSFGSQLLNNPVVDSMIMHWNGEIAMCIKGQPKVNCPGRTFHCIQPIPSLVELRQLNMFEFH